MIESIAFSIEEKKECGIFFLEDDFLLKIFLAYFDVFP